MRDEITEQVMRLKPHPSLILFSGNNENKQALQEDWYDTDLNKTLFLTEYMALYDGVVRGVVEDFVGDIPFLLSSPSNGESRGWVDDNPQSELAGDVHFYDYNCDCLNVSNLPVPRFASEFGFQSYPSLRTLRAAFRKRNVTLFDPNTEHRQHLVNGNKLLEEQVTRMFGKTKSRDNVLKGETLVYLTQLHQALCVSSEIAHFRRHYNRLLPDGRGMNTGVLLWQLNDVWAAPTWSIMDITLRPKMLFYAMRRLYKPVVGTGFWNGTHVEVFVINELDRCVDFSLDLFLYDVQSRLSLKEWFVSGKSALPRSSGLVFTISENILTNYCQNLARCFLAVEFSSKYENIRTQEIVRPAMDWKGLILKNPGLKVEVAQRKPDRLVLRILSQNKALWVWLEANEDGVFSKNFFTMYQPMMFVEFIPRRMTKICCHIHATSLYHHY